MEDSILNGDHKRLQADVNDNNELEVDGDGDDAVGRLVPRLGDAEGHGQEGDRQTTVSLRDWWGH